MPTHWCRPVCATDGVAMRQTGSPSHARLSRRQACPVPCAAASRSTRPPPRPRPRPALRPSRPRRAAPAAATTPARARRARPSAGARRRRPPASGAARALETPPACTPAAPADCSGRPRRTARPARGTWMHDCAGSASRRRIAEARDTEGRRKAETRVTRNKKARRLPSWLQPGPSGSSRGPRVTALMRVAPCGPRLICSPAGPGHCRGLRLRPCPWAHVRLSCPAAAPASDTAAGRQPCWPVPP